MPQLDLTTYFSQIFWLVVLFSALFVAMRWFVIPKMEGITTARRTKLADALRATEKLRTQAEQLENKYQTAMQQARKQAREEVRQQIEKAGEAATKKMEALEKELKASAAKSEKELEATATKILAELKNQRLVEKLASKVKNA